MNKNNVCSAFILRKKMSREFFVQKSKYLWFIFVLSNLTYYLISYVILLSDFSRSFKFNVFS